MSGYTVAMIVFVVSTIVAMPQKAGMFQAPSIDAFLDSLGIVIFGLT